MKAFEFQFNPGIDPTLVFESFCHEAENIYERKMGSICMLGELKRALPHNYRISEKIMGAIRKEFYSKFQRSPEVALKESLRRANDLLSAEVSKENTDWLGNLNFAIISLKNFNLQFTKVGGIKIFLIRGPHIIDIGQKLDNQEIEPYPLKIFNNIVSGKIAEGDLIIAVTEKFFPVFKGVINDISKISPLEEKEIRNLIKTRETQFAESSGSFILICATKTSPLASKSSKIVFQREPERFSILKALSPAVEAAKGVRMLFKKAPQLAKGAVSSFSNNLRKQGKKHEKKHEKEKEEPVTRKETAVPRGPVKIEVKVEESSEAPPAKAKKSEAKIPHSKMPSMKLPSFKLPSFNFPKIKVPSLNVAKFSSRKYLPISLFLALLLIGFFVFQNQERQKSNQYLVAIQTIQEKVVQAEGLMVLKNVNPDAAIQANGLLSESWQEILPITKIASGAQDNALSLKSEIEKDLKALNNLVEISDPVEFFTFDSNEYIPQKMLALGNDLYFFSPYVPNIIKINESGQSSVIQTETKFSESAVLSANSALLFVKPNVLTPLQNGELGQSFILETPYPGYNFNDVTSFTENLYFLDGQNGEIIRYLPPVAGNKDNPRKWLYSDAQKPTGGKSIAVDGTIWVLNGDNQLLRYRSGGLQETINLSVFPAPVGFSKIAVSDALSYIFIMEPIQNRIILAQKDGTIFEQFQSPKFDKLLDFAVSNDGKTLWVLNGLKVYKINL